MIAAIERQAKLTSDRLFDNMREAYDFREISAKSES
jgi:hypothetical protein